jgi:hypothetical protein
MGSIRCYLEQLHFNLFDLRSITLLYRRTNIAAFPRPFPKKGAVYRVVLGKKRPNTSVRLSLLKSLLKSDFVQLYIAVALKYNCSKSDLTVSLCEMALVKESGSSW